MATTKELCGLLLGVLAVMLWSWIDAFDRPTWWLESIPVVIAIPLLWATRANFPLTRLCYYLIAIHSIILLVGAHYTYARVPAGFWAQELFDFSRNHYDRLGHIAQGFVPAMIARELFIRLEIVTRKGWRFFLVTCFCLAFSAFYELLEWLSAIIGGDGSTDFLGTQGDVWDAQWDMFLALCGAVASQLLLGGWHSRQMAVRPYSA